MLFPDYHVDGKSRCRGDSNGKPAVCGLQGTLQPGSTLTLRMLSLKPSPSFFFLHSAAWLRQQNPLSSPQLGAPLQARCEAPRASCTKSGGYSPDASLTQGQQGGAQHLGGKQRLTQHAQRVSESRGPPWGGGLAMEGEGVGGGGGSQMDDIRDLLRTVAHQGERAACSPPLAASCLRYSTRHPPAAALGPSIFSHHVPHAPLLLCTG